MVAGDPRCRLANQAWAFVDKPAIHLYQAGTGADFIGGAGTIENPAHANNRQFPAQGGIERADDIGTFIAYRHATQTTRFTAILLSFNAHTGDGRVGGNHTIHTFL
jgi:hypothetical protein